MKPLRLALSLLLAFIGSQLAAQTVSGGRFG